MLTTCAAALLGVLCFSLFASDGPAARTIAFAAIVVGIACVADNAANLLARHDAEEARLRTIETAWLEAHIELALLRRRARDQGLDVETHHLAAEELHRQLSLPSPPAGEDGAALA